MIDNRRGQGDGLVFRHLSPIIQTFSGFAFEHYDSGRETPLTRVTAPSHTQISAMWNAMAEAERTIRHVTLAAFWVCVRQADDRPQEGTAHGPEHTGR